MIGRPLQELGRFQPTLPAQGRDEVVDAAVPVGEISTHSSRVGKRHSPTAYRSVCIHFNPLFPRREETRKCPLPGSMALFQPTLPAQGRDYSGRKAATPQRYFNPLFPRREETHHGRRMSGLCAGLQQGKRSVRMPTQIPQKRNYRKLL